MDLYSRLYKNPVDCSGSIWFGHGCPGDRTHSKMSGIMVSAWMPWCNRIHSKRNGIMVSAWMPWCNGIHSKRNGIMV